MVQRLSLITLGVADLDRARSFHEDGLVKDNDEVRWGGYSGYIADPDGHPWEIAHHRFWTIHEDSRTTLR
ncbi:hypothetical protein GL325_06485 [Aeromicrobium sp. 636]|uniref:VOC family protein n=1 Tax=Aeromicrobium senzhongii TaxID=2663859 RepID=A0A8I0ETS9_9ACTN|nr:MULTISPECIES: hypothetical protein [Aeromicrobium]MBC9225959.1 hypothetical protein [Aeromicrobium senzhongii]MCQ3998066.1 hypothetical protein [Aeromicrobium sp. 636]